MASVRKVSSSLVSVEINVYGLIEVKCPRYGHSFSEQARGLQGVDCAVTLEPIAAGTRREAPGVVSGRDAEGVPEDGKQVTKLAGPR